MATYILHLFWSVSLNGRKHLGHADKDEIKMVFSENRVWIGGVWLIQDSFQWPVPLNSLKHFEFLEGKVLFCGLMDYDSVIGA
jgi:hypothetical protein